MTYMYACIGCPGCYPGHKCPRTSEAPNPAVAKLDMIRAIIDVQYNLYGAFPRLVVEKICEVLEDTP